MENNAVLLWAIVGVVVLAVAFMFATGRRHDEQRALESTDMTTPGGATPAGPEGERFPVAVGAQGVAVSGKELERVTALRHETSRPPDMPPPPPALAVPPDDETLGITRRQVLNRGIVTTMVLAISGFSAAMIAMLWPTLSGGFGAKIRVGKLEDVMGEIETSKEPYYLGAGRLYVVAYPKEAVANARKVGAYSAVLDGYDQGVVALYQKCPHLGCRVPWCKTSQWFECPCHGSQYNRVGEKKAGPAPRGMDRFVASVEAGAIVVDTKTVIPGPPIGVNTTGQESEGPHCIGATTGEH